MLARDRFLRVQRVSVAAERADHQAAGFDRMLERFQFAFVGKQYVRIAMRVAGIAARADLDGIQAFGGDVVQSASSNDFCANNTANTPSFIRV